MGSMHTGLEEGGQDDFLEWENILLKGHPQALVL